jgi:hypothetical protein
LLKLRTTRLPLGGRPLLCRNVELTGEEAYSQPAE